jgi:hypothetical protein
MLQQQLLTTDYLLLTTYYLLLTAFPGESEMLQQQLKRKVQSSTKAA